MPIRDVAAGPRVLLKRLREIMVEALDPQARLDRIVREIASNMVAEVCSLYVLRADSVLELYATEGLNPGSVHHAQLRLGQGLVGTIAASARPLNLSDAQTHPAFAYLPEVGEEAYNAFLGVPVLRAGRTLGVLVVQNRTKRHYRDDEVEALETTAMVIAEMIAAGGLTRLTRPGLELDLSKPVSIGGASFNEGVGLGHVVLHEPRIVVTNLFNEDSDKELSRLESALSSLRLSIDDMLSRRDVAFEGEHRAVLEAYRAHVAERAALGIPPLREAIAEYLSAAGLPTSADQVIVTSGAQQALTLAGYLFGREGASVAIEDPTYSGALEVFRALEVSPAGKLIAPPGGIFIALENLGHGADHDAQRRRPPRRTRPRRLSPSRCTRSADGRGEQAGMGSTRSRPLAATREDR